MASTSSRFEPQAPDKSSSEETYGAERTGSYAEMAGLPTDLDGQEIDFLALIGRAHQLSRDYQLRTLERPLARNYRAWRNEHAEGSKYLGNAYRGRSRLFVPKTRAAVIKTLATAAGGLFSTEDVVNIAAAYDDDPKQVATAAVLKGALDYRLNRGAAVRHSMPWYLLCLGGCHDAQLTGVTISKQYWQFEEVVAKTTVEKPLLDEATGLPVTHIDGTPITYPEEVEERRVVIDRPMVDLIPVENVDIDPTAPWYAPAQLGRWLSVRYPMGLSDVHALLASADKDGNSAWIKVSDADLLKGRVEEDRTTTRRAREAGTDRYEDGRSTNDLDIVWLQENFLRISGVDYHFWSIGRHCYVSKVRETREAYPHFDGERPYVMGTGQIDPHRVFPMSPVESWQPLQLELNDITNLRQDTLKRAIAPLPMVKRGKNVDLVALQRRGQPEAILLVDDIEKDVKFQNTPGPTGAAYTETNVTNVMFDELAGVFSTSSVQSNRQLNETVGGMRLMSGSANAVSEFHLRTWVETWVEGVMRQLAHLVRAYESDEKILAIAGAKARVAERYNYIPALSDFDALEVTLKVDVGIGALDPMQQLAKLKVAGEMLAPMMPIFKEQGIKMKGDAWIEEIMGKVGYRDGRRFFEFGEPPDPQPDPDIVKLLKELEFKYAELKSKEQQNAENNRTKIEVEDTRTQGEILEKLIDVEHDREGRVHDREVEGDRQRHQSSEGSRQFARERIGKASDNARDDRHRVEDRKREDVHRKEDGDRARESEIASGRQRIREIMAAGASKAGKPASGKSVAGKPSADASGGKASNDQVMDAFHEILRRLEAMAQNFSTQEQSIVSAAQMQSGRAPRMRPEPDNPIVNVNEDM